MEPVGSCATLVAEKLMADDVHSAALSPVTSLLLYETIIADTVNFSPEARTATPKDHHIADELQRELLSASTREKIFEALIGLRNLQFRGEKFLRREDVKSLEYYSRTTSEFRSNSPPFQVNRKYLKAIEFSEVSIRGSREYGDNYWHESEPCWACPFRTFSDCISPCYHKS